MQLSTKIESARRTKTPRWGMTASGYTQKRGAPTSIMVRLEGEKRERRLMVWQFSNAGTLFLRIKGKTFTLSDSDLPRIKEC